MWEMHGTLSMNTQSSDEAVVIGLQCGLVFKQWWATGVFHRPFPSELQEGVKAGDTEQETMP